MDFRNLIKHFLECGQALFASDLTLLNQNAINQNAIKQQQRWDENQGRHSDRERERERKRETETERERGLIRLKK
jgi:Ni/Co efflux regulator RcnB